MIDFFYLSVWVDQKCLMGDTKIPYCVKVDKWPLICQNSSHLRTLFLIISPMKATIKSSKFLFIKFLCMLQSSKGFSCSNICTIHSNKRWYKNTLIYICYCSTVTSFIHMKTHAVTQCNFSKSLYHVCIDYIFL